MDKFVSYESFYCKEMAPFWAQHTHNCIQLAYGQQAQASFAQTYNLKQGLKEFGEEGEASAMKEIGQIHGRGSLSPVCLRDLTDEEAKKAFDLVIVMLRKQNGIVKTRMCLNGSMQKNWMSKEDIASPTAAPESAVLTSAVDAYERREVATVDVPNAFMQAHIDTKPGTPEWS